MEKTPVVLTMLGIVAQIAPNIRLIDRRPLPPVLRPRVSQLGLAARPTAGPYQVLHRKNGV
jgi:hypothetical protein